LGGKKEKRRRRGRGGEGPHLVSLESIHDLSTSAFFLHETTQNPGILIPINTYVCPI